MFTPVKSLQPRLSTDPAPIVHQNGSGQPLFCAACTGQRAAGDALTGLADRALFRELLAAALADPPPGLAEGPPSEPCSPAMAVLLIDLDRFKAVNDTLGHAAGDALLRAVAKRLRHALREGDAAARLGGDEFAILLGCPASQEAVSAFAARIVELLSRPYIIDGAVANVGASVGAAVASAGDGIDAEALLHRADLAMYQAKAEGRNRSCFFEPRMQERADARRRLEADLRAALALGQFELFYQPQLQLGSGRLAGFEALLRWRHPTSGLVAPEAFISLAEELHLISSIGEWAVRAACAEAATWPGGLVVAVNVAADQFDNGRLVSSVAGALQASGLPGTQLELEITEAALLRTGPSTIEQLHALKQLGAQISLDDFGTGYSSLTQLRSFPFSRVKIHRSFASDPALGRVVAALGASLGMRTTAEGVETTEQIARLTADGCTDAQGDLLSQPVPAAEVGGVIGRLSGNRGGALLAQPALTSQQQVAA